MMTTTHDQTTMTCPYCQLPTPLVESICQHCGDYIPQRLRA